MVTLIKELARTAPLVCPGMGKAAWFGRFKYCARGLFMANCSREWFRELRRPELELLVTYHPYIYCKLQRPYLHRKLNPRQRLAILQHHYRFVANRFSQRALQGIYATAGFLMAIIPLEGVGNFGIRLCHSRHTKEGDLLLHLTNLDSGQTLFEMSFCISRFARDGVQVFIGGLQGNKLANDRDTIVQLTRAMYGLRPKALLVFAIQQLAAGWNATKILAVSDANHIYRHHHKRKDLTASYDAFWIECGGSMNAEGMFELPVTFVPRETSAIKVNKRQLYGRRYALVTEIAQQISGTRPLMNKWEQRQTPPVKVEDFPRSPALST
jgi:uncharacterized protein VirK/YbjX